MINYERHGITALMAAIRFGDNNKHHAVVDNKAAKLEILKDSIALGVNEGDEEIPFIDYILRATECLDIDKESYGGDSALILACRLGKAKIVDLLLRRGADANLETKKGTFSFL